MKVLCIGTTPAAQRVMIFRKLTPDAVNRAGTTLDGGIEVRFLKGPVFLDKDYLLAGRVVAVGQSPKTEDLWIESSLRDPENGLTVAEFLLMARWMKNSSPLYDGKSQAQPAT